MPYLLFDIAIAVILLVFALRGASKGFVLSLFGLLAVVVAFVGANLAASALAPKVGEILEPKFAASIQKALEDGMEQGVVDYAPTGGEAVTPETMPLPDVLRTLRAMGLYTKLIDSVEESVRKGMTEAAAGAAARVAAAIAQSVAFAALFLVFFVLILVGWTLLAHALDLVARLPGLHFLNRAGGAAMGLVKGCIFLFLAAWLLRYVGDVIPAEAMKETWLLRFFMTWEPLSLLRGVPAPFHE